MYFFGWGISEFHSQLLDIQNLVGHPGSKDSEGSIEFHGILDVDVSQKSPNPFIASH